MKKINMKGMNKKVLVATIGFGLVIVAILIVYAINLLGPVQVSGNFGYPGESTGAPTTIVMIRRDEHRILVASSGEYGEVVAQAARWSTVTSTGLDVADMNQDGISDVIADGLVLYGTSQGLQVWEPGPSQE